MTYDFGTYGTGGGEIGAGSGTAGSNDPIGAGSKFSMMTDWS